MEMRKGSYAGLNDFVIMLRGLQEKEDLDALIGVSGFKGFGKSTFSKQVLIRYVEKYMGIKDFRPSMLENYTAYTKQDLFTMLEELPEYAPIDVDEAVNFAMGEDWMKSGNKRVKKVMAKIRTKHHIFFFNIPDLWWLDKKYRENMMTVWTHIVKKGHVMVSLPNTAPGIKDRWDRPWLQKAFTKHPINYFTPLKNIMKSLRKYSCYYDEFAFPKLSQQIYTKHLDLRDSKMMDTPEDEEVITKSEFKYRDLCQRIGWNAKHNGASDNFKEWYDKYTKVPGQKKPFVSYKQYLNIISEVEAKQLSNHYSVSIKV